MSLKKKIKRSRRFFMVRVLFIGDIFGNLGRKALKKHLRDIKKERGIL